MLEEYDTSLQASLKCFEQFKQLSRTRLGRFELLVTQMLWNFQTAITNRVWGNQANEHSEALLP